MKKIINITIIILSVFTIKVSYISALTDLEIETIRDYNLLTEKELNNLKNGTGKLTQEEIKLIKEGKRKLTYEDFYAKGDGVTNDYLFIKAAHEFANRLYIEEGIMITVYGNQNSTYYMSVGNKSPVIYKGSDDGKANAENTPRIDIVTNVDWQGAKFIFDDYVDSNEDGLNDVHYWESIFSITSAMNAYAKLCENNKELWYLDLDSEELSNLKYGTNTTNMKAIVGLVKDNDSYKNTECNGINYVKKSFDNAKYWQVIVVGSKRRYIRSGANENDGENQQETFVIDSETGESMQKLQWDYDTIENIYVYPISNIEIKVQNANITTLTNNVAYVVDDTLKDDSKKLAYKIDGKKYKKSSPTRRGIDVFYTGNVEISNITHEINEEAHAGLTKYPLSEYNTKYKNANIYSGFLRIMDSSYVKLKNIKLYPHTPSPLIQTIDNEITKSGNNGTYDFTIYRSTDIFVDNMSYSCTTGEDDACYADSMLNNDKWGIMGSNYSKNIFISNSKLNRVDAHMGIYNLKVEHSTIGVKGFSLIGAGGTFYANDVTVDGAQNMLYLRDDYGSTFDGDIIMNNITFKPRMTANITLVYSKNDGTHNYGYKSYFPNVYVENSTIDWSNFAADESTDKKYIFHFLSFANIKDDRETNEDSKYYIKDNIVFNNIKLVGTDRFKIFNADFVSNNNNLLKSSYGSNNTTNIFYSIKDSEGNTLEHTDTFDYDDTIKFKIVDKLNYSTTNQINELNQIYEKSYNLLDNLDSKNDSEEKDNIVDSPNTKANSYIFILGIFVIIFGLVTIVKYKSNVIKNR